MSIIRNKTNAFLNIRNFAGVLMQVKNITERKPNLRKPKDPDFNKKVLLTLIEPFYEKDRRPDSEKCKERMEKENYVPHPYIKMLSEDCAKDLKSKYIYLFHLNFLSNNDFNELRKNFLRENIYLRNYSTEVIKLAIEQSRLFNLYQFFRHYGCFAISPVEKMNNIVKLCKANNKIILMGAVIDDRILNLKQLEEYNKYGGIDAVRSQLCNTLSNQSLQLSSTLSYHSNELYLNLINHSKNDVIKKKVDSSIDKNGKINT